MKLAIVFPNLSHRKNNDVPGTRFERSDLGGFIIRSPGGLLHTCFGDFQGGTLLPSDAGLQSRCFFPLLVFLVASLPTGSSFHS